MMTDPIADFLARIRNAIIARKETVEMPSSRIKVRIAQILEDEGFINGWLEGKDERGFGTLKIKLKYNSNKVNSIRGLQRVSKPSRRRYVGKKEIPQVLGGLGVAILTTSRGVMTDRSARDAGVGGELICEVW